MCDPGNSNWCSVIDGVGGREAKGRGTHVYLWLTHVDVWQKSMQYCKAIILQLKTNKLKKKHCILNIILHYKEKALLRRMPGFKTEAEKK